MAAPPAYKAPPPIVAPLPYNWTGIYIGGHLGAGWGVKTWDDQDDLSDNVVYNTTGGLGGGQIGFNWQFDRWVFGAEWDISGTNIRGSGNLNPLFEGGLVVVEGENVHCNECTVLNTKIDWISTLTARWGFASDRWLYYLKGGLAWVRERHGLSEFEPDEAIFMTDSVTQTRTGWTVGFGVEYAFYNNWSAKLEYNYLDFGKKAICFVNTQECSGDTSVLTTVDQQLHVVKAGLNYKFNWGLWGKAPVAARY
jgi:outer membrane immunogenic protein